MGEGAILKRRTVWGFKINPRFCENQSVILWNPSAILVKSECDFGTVGVWFCENQPVMLWKSASDFGKVGLWFWESRSVILNRYNFTKYDTINFATYITLCNTYYFSIYLGLYYISLRGYEKMVWDRTASIFMTRLYETGLHPFYDKMAWDRTAFILRQDCMRQDCIHFYDKIVWDRTAFIFMTRQHKTGTHPFLWQASIIPVLIHFYDNPA